MKRITPTYWIRSAALITSLLLTAGCSLNEGSDTSTAPLTEVAATTVVPNPETTSTIGSSTSPIQDVNSDAPDMSLLTGAVIINCRNLGNLNMQNGSVVGNQAITVTLTVLDPKSGKATPVREFQIPATEKIRIESPGACGAVSQDARKYFNSDYSSMAIGLEGSGHEPHAGYVDASTGKITDVSEWISGSGNFSAIPDHHVPMFDETGNLIFWDNTKKVWLVVDLKEKKIVNTITNTSGYDDHQVFVTMPFLPVSPIWKIDSMRFLVHYTGDNGDQDSIALWTSEVPLTNDEKGREIAGEIGQDISWENEKNDIASTQWARMNTTRLSPLMDSGGVDSATISPDLKSGLIKVAGARSGESLYALDSSNPENLSPLDYDLSGSRKLIDWIEPR